MMSDQAKFQQTWSTESTGNLPDESMKIAVCGMAVRLPGGIASPEQLWDVLINKVDTQSSVPATRYDAEHFYSKSGKPGHVRSRRGYFLDDSVDLGALDTTFFNFSRQALEKLDPQVRLLLELVYECFESAGERDYRGKPIGCFVGGNTGEWSEHLGRDPQAYGMHRTTGRGGFSLANRLSYEYDLKGPSMSLETACSSSLVALHQACQAIRGGDCAAALVGGANLIRTPSLTLDLTGDGAISPTASCRTFDASADGYARGEAVNMVYLKNLDDALRDGNPIHAVIRGSATNSDGKTAGFTLPSAVAQESLIREAYRKAGIVDPSQTAFIELHGTGTPTGDPIETAAAGNVFKSGIYIGSIKPNTGHGEGASGITSFIKAVLTLQHAVIPPNIKFQNPNPRIRFEEHRLEVPVVPMSWPENKAKRVSVNSFGIGGSNAHVVLDSADSFFTPATNMQPIRSPSTRSLLLFSANCEESLWRQVTNQQQFLADGSHKQFDLAYTLSLRRNHLPHRAFSVAHRGEISFTSEALRAPENPARTIMVFTGQGSQYVRMGAELAEHNEVFAATLRRLNEVLASLPEPPSWNIWDEIMSPGAQSRVDIPEYSQPLTTATQIALVDTLASLGVHPFAVVGHSSGEIAAAYAAGKLKADEAITVAYYRGIVAGRAKSSGAMAAVDMTRLETESFLVQGSCIACENSPCSVTISGDDDKVESVLEAIRSAKPEVLARRLKVDRAYHSSHMKDVGDTFQSEVSRFKVGQGMSQSCLFFSTTTGRELEAHDPVDGPYWKNNLEQPVLFHTAVRQLAEHSVVASSRDNLAFLEIGPHGVLGGPIRQILAETSVVSSYVSCLNRKDDAMEAFLKAVGHLHLKRIPIDFNTLTNPYSDGQTLSDLPTYPWHHATPLLFETRVTRAYRYRGSKKHELLGLRVAESTEIEPSWRNLLQLEEVSWMRDHLISGQVVFPGVGYIAMAGEAAKQVSGDEYVGFSLASVSFDLPMVLIDGKTTELITSLRRSKLNDGLESSWYDFVISSHNGSSWTKHCTGQVRPQTVRSNHRPLFQTHPRIVEARDWYETLKEVGAVFGFAFQGLTNITCSPTSYEAGANISDTWFDEEVEYDIHPTKLDAVLHLFAIANSNGLGRKTTRLVLPAYIEQLHIFSPAGPGVSANVQADCTPRGTISGHAFAVADDGQVVLRMSGVKLRPLEYNSGTVIEDVHKGAKLIWQPHTDFIDLDLLVHGHHDQERLMTDVGHVTSLYTREMLRRLEGVETSQPHLEKYRRWLMVQPQGETNASLDEAFSKLNGTVYQEILKPMREVLDNIVRVFNGEVQPLEILTQDVLTAVYNYGPLADRSEMVRTFGHTKPNLRILEIVSHLHTSWQDLPDRRSHFAHH
jgi:acyl transferase domain-containing protein